MYGILSYMCDKNQPVMWLYIYNYLYICTSPVDPSWDINPQYKSQNLEDGFPVPYGDRTEGLGTGVFVGSVAVGLVWQAAASLTEIWLWEKNGVSADIGPHVSSDEHIHILRLKEISICIFYDLSWSYRWVSSFAFEGSGQHWGLQYSSKWFPWIFSRGGLEYPSSHQFVYSSLVCFSYMYICTITYSNIYPKTNDQWFGESLFCDMVLWYLGCILLRLIFTLLVSMLTLRLRVCPFVCATPPTRTFWRCFFSKEVVGWPFWKVENDLNLNKQVGMFFFQKYIVNWCFHAEESRSVDFASLVEKFKVPLLPFAGASAFHCKHEWLSF